MKKELIGVLICTLLIATAVLPATGTTTINKNTLSEERSDLQKLSPGSDRSSDILLEFVPGEMIIKFREDVDISISFSSKNVVTIGVTSVDMLNEKYSVTSVEKLFGEFQISPLSTIYKFILPDDTDIPSVANEYSMDPCVLYAEPNYLYQFYGIPDDPYFEQQWALHQESDCDIDAPEAWDIEIGSSDVVIAVVDSGVDYNHPDLAANIWINSGEDLNGNGVVDPSDFNEVDDDDNGFVDDIRGYDFVDTNIPVYPGEDGKVRDNDPMDFHGHGTHCSGIASAVTNNTVGIAGVCWNCQIMSVRAGFKGENGNGYLEFDDAAAAIVYATDNGPDVISMSFGGPDSGLVHDAINYAYSQGVLLVASAGNDNTNDKSYPAGYSNVIAVAATDSSDSKASFSNYGDWIDVAAPGVSILSTLPNNKYASWSGTSMACPHVAGLTALILSKNQSFDQEQVRTIICDSADRLPPPEKNLGEGRINAFNALLRGPGPATAEISSPKHGGEINGVIDVQGSAYGEGFQYFTIEYGKCMHLIPGNWVEILNSTIPVQNGVFTSLNTSAMGGEGLYNIRLTLVCSNGIYKDNIWSLVNNEQNTIYVDDDGGSGVFTSIRNGILCAGRGDTVFVYNGTYYENVLIWKSIDLIGEEKNTTIIDGNYKGSVIDINSNNVVVRGFTLKNIESHQHFEGKYGCVKINAENVLITDNIITPGEVWDEWHGEGILIPYGASNNKIQNNIIFYDKPDGTVVGVKIVYQADSNTIYNNEIYGCFSAVSIYPMMGGGCNNNIIDSNYFHNLDIGVSIMDSSSGTKVISNNINNCGMSGVSLLNADDNLIDNNTIAQSETGVFLSGESNIISNNNISYNAVGVSTRGSIYNKIYYNNFVGNTQNGYDGGFRNIWYKFKLFGKSMGNYWDDYTGTDNDGDGIGDTPYNIPSKLNAKDKYPLMKPFNGSQSNQNSQSQISNQQSTNPLFLRLLEQFPNSFPMLRQLLVG